MVEEALEEMGSSAVSPELQQEHRVSLPTAAARSDLISARGELSRAFILDKVMGVEWVNWWGQCFSPSSLKAPERLLKFARLK